MKFTILTVIASLTLTMSHGQTNPLLGQYFQNMPAYNPALAGMNNNLEITLGARQQWAGFNGAPRTFYLSAYGVLGAKTKEIPVSSDEQTETPVTKSVIKHAAGGYVLSNEQGPYKQREVSAVYAVHVPVATGTYLSLGMSASAYNDKVDVLDVWVKDQTNDQTYQSMLQNGSSNTYLHLNTGLSLYSKSYYASYSMMEATGTFLGGNKDVNKDNRSVRHQIMAGYRFFLHEKWELIPNTFVRIDQSRPTLYEGGIRARYNGNVWAGVSYRNNKTTVAMLGMTLNNKIWLGYAFEYQGADMSSYNQGSHEIVLGLRLFNASAASVMW